MSSNFEDYELCELRIYELRITNWEKRMSSGFAESKM